MLYETKQLRARFHSRLRPLFSFFLSFLKIWIQSRNEKKKNFFSTYTFICMCIYIFNWEIFITQFFRTSFYLFIYFKKIFIIIRISSVFSLSVSVVKIKMYLTCVCVYISRSYPELNLLLLSGFRSAFCSKL